MRRFTLQPDRLVDGPRDLRRGRVASPQPRAPAAAGRHRASRPTAPAATTPCGSRAWARPPPGRSSRKPPASRNHRWPSPSCRAIPKGDKMEAIVRAATELGVARFRPALCERTIVRLEPARWRDRPDAGSGSPARRPSSAGRAVVPEVELPRPLAECLDTAAADLALCLWEGGGQPLGTTPGGRRPRPAPPWSSWGPRGDSPWPRSRPRGRAGSIVVVSGPAHPADRDGGPGGRGASSSHGSGTCGDRGAAGSTSRSRPTSASAAGAPAGRWPSPAHARRLRLIAATRRASSPGAARGPCPGRLPGDAAGDLDRRVPVRTRDRGLRGPRGRDDRLHGHAGPRLLHGEPLDLARHRVGTVVKGATLPPVP